MATRPDEMQLHLEAREILHVHDGLGVQVTCVAGILWITQSNDTSDIVVHAGQSFVLDRPGLALVSAPTAPADVLVRSMTRHARPITISLGLRSAA